MGVKELQIGDWVSYDGEYVKIEGITTDSGRYKYPFCVSYCDGRDFAHIAVLNVDPIPLTEEILLKNGFILDEEWGEYRIELNKTYFSLEYTAKKESCYITISTYSEIIKIKYVHELQHLLRLCRLDDLVDNFKI